jgi:hypothetical protein
MLQQTLSLTQLAQPHQHQQQQQRSNASFTPQANSTLPATCTGASCSSSSSCSSSRRPPQQRKPPRRARNGQRQRLVVVAVVVVAVALVGWVAKKLGSLLLSWLLAQGASGGMYLALETASSR